MNINACTSYTPVENIRYALGTSPLAGTYNALVRYYEQHDTMTETEFILQLKVGSEKLRDTGTI